MFVFKYLTFAATSIDSLLRATGLKMQIPTFELILPVGISFFSFQMIGYLVDVVERWLRDAARKSGDKWIVLMTHSGKDDFSLDDLESFVKCAKSLGCEFMTASAAAETWRNRGWEPSARPAVEHSRADEIADLVRFHWLYVLGMAICGTVILAALILILRRIKMI